MKTLKIKFILFLSLWITSTFSASAVNDWFHVFYKNSGLERVKSYLLNDIDSVFYSVEEGGTDIIDGNDSSTSESPADFVNYINIAKKDGIVESLPIDSLLDMKVGDNVATIFIDTDEWVSEIPDKENYLTANFRYVPYDGLTEPLEATVNIRGRGNTTWEYEKKPYRLKFDKKQPLAGMKKAKSFALIANYLDNTLMKNTVAFKIAELLGMEYHNSSIPVDVVLNGEYKGSYMLTEKIGINSGSVDIDEELGILWELDTHYDEEFKYYTSRYNIPAMVKDPDFNELAEEDLVYREAMWKFWRADLDLAFAKIYKGEWEEVVDVREFVKYLLVNDIIGNFDLSYPKSVYLYKEKAGEKYKFGPVWDFDWATNYVASKPVDFPLFYGPATSFFWKMAQTETFRDIFFEELDRFSEESLPQLLDFIDEYAQKLRVSALHDAERWPAEHQYDWEKVEINCAHFDENVKTLKDYIVKRIELIRQDKNLLFHD